MKNSVWLSWNFCFFKYSNRVNQNVEPVQNWIFQIGWKDVVMWQHRSIWILDFDKYRACRSGLNQVLTESFRKSVFRKMETKKNEFHQNWSEIFEDFPAAKRIPNSKHPIRIKLLFFCPSITIRTSWFQTDSNGEFLWPFFVTTLHRINYQNFTALSVFCLFSDRN